MFNLGKISRENLWVNCGRYYTPTSRSVNNVSCGGRRWSPERFRTNLDKNPDGMFRWVNSAATEMLGVIIGSRLAVLYSIRLLPGGKKCGS